MQRTTTMKVKKMKTSFHLAKDSNLTMIREHQAIHARQMLNLNALSPIRPPLPRISRKNLRLANRKISPLTRSRLIRIWFKMSVHLFIRSSPRRILWLDRRVGRRAGLALAFQSKLSSLMMFRKINRCKRKSRHLAKIVIRSSKLRSSKLNSKWLIMKSKMCKQFLPRVRQQLKSLIQLINQ